MDRQGGSLPDRRSNLPEEVLLFHQDFIKGKITLIGCPKLDSVDYSEKLIEIIRQNNIKSVTIVRMEVPCCGGIQNAAINAMKASGKFLPWQVYTISTDGRILA